MIAKISTGGGFRGSLDYILRAESEPEIIGGNLSGTTPKELSREFGITRKLREDIEKPVYHISLTLPAGERLGNGTWEQITNDYLTKMGLDPDRHQHIIVRHRDTDHDHIHILTSRIDLQGQVFDAFRDRVKSKNICRELEADYKLTQVENEKKIYRAKTTQRERRMMERTGRTTEKVLVQEALTQLLDKENPISHRAFISALEAEGVIAIPNIASTGKMNGYGFQYGGRNYTGSQTGYAWKHLQNLLQEPDAETVAYLQHRKEILQQGTPADAVRSVRNAVWEIGVRNVGFAEALEKQGWTLTGRTLSKGEARYNLDQLVDTKKLTESLWTLQQITGREKEQARAKASKLAKSFYTPRRSFMAEVRAEDLLVGMIMVPQAVLFLLALSVVTEAVRGIGIPQNEKELEARLKEIWAESSQRVDEAVSQVRKGVEHRGGARTTGSNQTDSHRTENDGRPATAENTGRGPNNAEVGSTPDPTASGTSGDDGDDGRDGEGLQVETENLNLDRPRGDADRYQSPDTQPQPAGGQQDNVQAASTLGAVAVSEWASLAADIEVLSRSGEDMKEKSNSVQVKEQAWNKQASALQAPLYRVTVRGRGQVGDKVINLCKPGKNLQEVLWDAEKVRSSIPSLEAWNARGYDIYLTPIDDDYHHILLDDLTAEGVLYVKKNFGACLIQTSSEDNFQAILRVPKAGTSPGEQSAGNELLQKLNRLPDGCGGDKAISAPRHPFRMCGFANKKPGKNNFYTRVELLQPGAVCEKANRELEGIRERRAGERGAAEVERKKEAIRTVETREIARPEGETPTDREFRRHWRRIAGLGEYGVREGIWSQADDSVVDYRTCQEMLKQGYGDAEILDSLLHCSPELLTRHRNPEDYCQRTLGAAKMALEVMGGGAMKETKEKPVYDGR